jgi:U32 family peptidase
LNPHKKVLIKKSHIEVTLLKAIEILAPAGSKAAMIGAINAKANAIYLAGKKFGARAYANNFEDNELYEMIDYAHLRGVFVYVAINTLIFDDEIDGLLEYTDQLVKHGIDAFIVQDLGVIDLLTKRYPEVDIHASTQVNTLNIHQAKFLKSLGVKRIVMARETPLKLIKQIKKQVDIELEVFVHGALCVCYSGNCLMSSMLGGRSGNRGECAQPCRLPYTLLKDNIVINDQSYLLSTKDLMTLEYMNQLIEAGVDSIKIEGRMRKPEYVIQAVLSYRKAIDAYHLKQQFKFDEELLKLKKVFNRDFTKGYLFNETPNQINHDYRPNHMGIPLGVVTDYKDNKVTIKLISELEVNDGYRILGNPDYGDTVSRIIKGNDIIKRALTGDIIKLDVTQKIEKYSQVLKTKDSRLESSLEVYLNENYKSIPLTGNIVAMKHELMTLEISDGIHKVSTQSKNSLTEALTKPVLKSQIVDQISKLGNTPFYFESLHVKTDNLCFIPIKDMNEMRREALDQLISIRTSYQTKVINIENTLSTKAMDHKVEFAVKVTTKKQFDEVIKFDLDTIYYEDTIKEIEHRENIIPVIKRIQMHPYNLKSSKLISEVGSIVTHDFTHKLYTDEYMNVTNIHTLRMLALHNISRVTLSPELSKERILKLVEKYKATFKETPAVELVVYGAVDLMITKYCPIAKTFKTKENCHLCELNQYDLMSLNGLKFPLINDGNCNLRILNYKPLNLIEHVKEIIDAGISIRLNFTTESEEEVQSIIQKFQLALKEKPKPISLKKFTYGRFIDKIQSEQKT